MLPSISTLAVLGSCVHPVTNVDAIQLVILSFLEKEGFETQENFMQFQVDNGYTSLRDFLDKAKYKVSDGADQACGWSDPKGIPQQIPEDGTMSPSGYTHDAPEADNGGSQTASSSSTTETPTTTEAPTTESTDTPATEATQTQAPSTDVGSTPTPATTEKCNAPRRRVRA
uniref:Uncharacterized protein n=2 Tax=Phytophthora ramorum TaxID=164328 RepID=H3H660_PHYRM